MVLPSVSPVDRVTAKLDNIVLEETHELKKRPGKRGRPTTKHTTIDIGCIRYDDITGLEDVLARAQKALHKLCIKPTFEAVALASYVCVDKEVTPQRTWVNLTGKSRARVAEWIGHSADTVEDSLVDNGLERFLDSLELSKQRVLGLIDRLSQVQGWVWEESED